MRYFSVIVIYCLCIALCSAAVNMQVALPRIRTTLPKSFVLESGTAFIDGSGMIASTHKQCPAGFSPKVMTGINSTDAASNPNCPINAIYASGAYAKANRAGGYNVNVVKGHVDTPVGCTERGINLYWSVFCMRTLNG